MKDYNYDSYESYADYYSDIISDLLNHDFRMTLTLFQHLCLWTEEKWKEFYNFLDTIDHPQIVFSYDNFLELQKEVELFKKAHEGKEECFICHSLVDLENDNYYLCPSSQEVICECCKERMI